MLDNITFKSEFSPPTDFYNPKGEPFEYNGLTYFPHYRRGAIDYYWTELENLRIHMYPKNIYLKNSLHKYHYGNNFCDYYFNDLVDTIKSLNEKTGINWYDARVTRLEFGCNIIANSTRIRNSLISYRNKNYLPMQHKGKVYGAACECSEFRIKAYDKTFEVNQNLGTNLNLPIFRWEVRWTRVRGIEKLLNCCPLKVKDLLVLENLKLLASDCIKKYEDSLRNRQIDLSNFSPYELRLLAYMRNPEIREEIKIHHKDTHKRDTINYNKLIRKISMYSNDYTKDELTKKFEELLFVSSNNLMPSKLVV